MKQRRYMLLDLALQYYGREPALWLPADCYSLTAAFPRKIDAPIAGTARRSMEPELNPPLPSSSSSNTISPSTIYASFAAYPFLADPEWQSGVSSILGHPGTPATDAELDANPGLILNAKLFYFSRKQDLPPDSIDAAGYVDWLRSQTQKAQNHEADLPSAALSATSTTTSEPTHIAAQPLATSSSTPSRPSQTLPSSSQDPPYPTSFAAIIDLITANKPVPGIEEIPDTVLEPGSSKIDHTPRRRKPWERDGDSDTALVAAAQPQTKEEGSTTGEREGEPTSQRRQPSSVTEGNAGPLETESSSMGTTDPALSSSTIPNPVITGEGVVKILQPNAIPPSGLLAACD